MKTSWGNFLKRFFVVLKNDRGRYALKRFLRLLRIAREQVDGNELVGITDIFSRQGGF